MLTADRNIQIVESYKNGVSSEQIARNVGLSSSQVLRVLKAEGVEIRHQKVPSDSQRQAIVEAYTNGDSTQKIARAFQISTKTAYDIVKASGLEFRLQHNTLAGRKVGVIALYKQGKTVNEVAACMSTTPYRVYYLLKKEGLTRSYDEANAACWLSGKRAACSDRIRARNQANKGEKSPAWKGGKTTLSKLLRSSARYFEWRKAVFIRDRFACQWCGKRNGRKRVIEADHIYPFSALLHDHQIKTVEQAEQCPQLWDLSNGRTLCKSCHEKTDTYQNGAKKYIRQPLA